MWCVLLKVLPAQHPMDVFAVDDELLFREVDG